MQLMTTISDQIVKSNNFNQLSSRPAIPKGRHKVRVRKLGLQIKVRHQVTAKWRSENES